MFKVAWRNLWRNQTRTVITIIAIALTYTLYLMMMGIQDYTYEQMEEAAAKAAGGSVLVQGKGFQDSQLNDIVIDDGRAVVERVESQELVDVVSARVIINGLLSTSASSSPVSLHGIDSSREKRFQDMGEYLVEGTMPGPQDTDPLVIGARLADELDVGLGDRVVLTATAGDAEMQRALFHVSGIFKTGSSMMDRGLAFTTIEAAQRSLKMDASITQIGVMGHVGPDELANVLRKELGAVEGVEVLTWAEAMPDVVGFIEMDKAYGDVFAIVLFLVVLFSIMNTFLMAVMERVRELGLLGALGLTPWRIVKLVIAETFLLTLVSLAIGLTLGLIGHQIIATVGIDMATFYGESLEISGIALTDTMIYSTIDVSRWINATVSVIVMVLFSAAYPAYKAAKLSPTEAMRFYE